MITTRWKEFRHLVRGPCSLYNINTLIDAAAVSALDEPDNALGNRKFNNLASLLLLNLFPPVHFAEKTSRNAVPAEKTS